jgi:thiol-disulfide isomerase/thioredoxin
MRLFFLALCALMLPALDAANQLSGRRAPGFSLSDRNMQQHDPADYRGKIVIIDFMQTTCPHCVTLTPILEQVKAKYPDRVVVLSVVVPPDTIDMVNKYIQEHKVTSPILFDCGQVTASYMKITPQNPKMEFPHLFLLDGDGNIRADFGSDPASKDVLEGKGLFAEVEKMFKLPPMKK